MEEVEIAEHPNTERIRRGLLTRRATEPTQEDLEFLWNLFREDVVWHSSGSTPISGEHRGRDAVFGVFQQIAQAGDFKRDIVNVLADDFHAVALVHNDVRKDEKHMEWYEAMVFHLDSDGKIEEFWALHEDPDAVDDLWR